MRTTADPILIVEDDAGTAELQKRVLERRGFSVLVSSGEHEALRALSGRRVALILLDNRLPDGVTGLDIFARLKEAGHDVPVILITAQADATTMAEAMKQGVRDFIAKSDGYLEFLPEVVARTLRQIETEQ